MLALLLIFALASRGLASSSSVNCQSSIIVTDVTNLPASITVADLHTCVYIKTKCNTEEATPTTNLSYVLRDTLDFPVFVRAMTSTDSIGSKSVVAESEDTAYSARSDMVLSQLGAHADYFGFVVLFTSEFLGLYPRVPTIIEFSVNTVGGYGIGNTFASLCHKRVLDQESWQLRKTADGPSGDNRGGLETIDLNDDSPNNFHVFGGGVKFVRALTRDSLGSGDAIAVDITADPPWPVFVRILGDTSSEHRLMDNCSQIFYPGGGGGTLYCPLQDLEGTEYIIVQVWTNLAFESAQGSIPVTVMHAVNTVTLNRPSSLQHCLLDGDTATILSNSSNTWTPFQMCAFQDGTQELRTDTAGKGVRVQQSSLTIQKGDTAEGIFFSVVCMECTRTNVYVVFSNDTHTLFETWLIVGRHPKKWFIPVPLVTAFSFDVFDESVVPNTFFTMWQDATGFIPPETYTTGSMPIHVAPELVFTSGSLSATVVLPANHDVLQDINATALPSECFVATKVSFTVQTFNCVGEEMTLVGVHRRIRGEEGVLARGYTFSDDPFTIFEISTGNIQCAMRVTVCDEPLLDDTDPLLSDDTNRPPPVLHSITDYPDNEFIHKETVAVEPRRILVRNYEVAIPSDVHNTYDMYLRVECNTGTCREVPVYVEDYTSHAKVDRDVFQQPSIVGTDIVGVLDSDNGGIHPTAFSTGLPIPVTDASDRETFMVYTVIVSNLHTDHAFTLNVSLMTSSAQVGVAPSSAASSNLCSDDSCLGRRLTDTGPSSLRVYALNATTNRTDVEVPALHINSEQYELRIRSLLNAAYISPNVTLPSSFLSSYTYETEAGGDAPEVTIGANQQRTLRHDTDPAFRSAGLGEITLIATGRSDLFAMQVVDTSATTTPPTPAPATTAAPPEYSLPQTLSVTPANFTIDAPEFSLPQDGTTAVVSIDVSALSALDVGLYIVLPPTCVGTTVNASVPLNTVIDPDSANFDGRIFQTFSRDWGDPRVTSIDVTISVDSGASRHSDCYVTFPVVRDPTGPEFVYAGAALYRAMCDFRSDNLNPDHREISLASLPKKVTLNADVSDEDVPVCLRVVDAERVTGFWVQNGEPSCPAHLTFLALDAELEGATATATSITYNYTIPRNVSMVRGFAKIDSGTACDEANFLFYGHESATTASTTTTTTRPNTARTDTSLLSLGLVVDVGVIAFLLVLVVVVLIVVAGMFRCCPHRTQAYADEGEEPMEMGGFDTASLPRAM